MPQRLQRLATSYDSPASRQAGCTACTHAHTLTHVAQIHRLHQPLQKSAQTVRGRDAWYADDLPLPSRSSLLPKPPPPSPSSPPLPARCAPASPGFMWDRSDRKTGFSEFHGLQHQEEAQAGGRPQAREKAHLSLWPGLLSSTHALQGQQTECTGGTGFLQGRVLLLVARVEGLVRLLREPPAAGASLQHARGLLGHVACNSLRV